MADIEPELLSSTTDLPDDVEESLIGSNTLEFERSRGIDYGEKYTLVPSVAAYDLPLLTMEQFNQLIAARVSGVPISELVADSAKRVSDFDDGGAERAAEFAKHLSEAVNSIVAKRR
jgi:hypothetical protein